MNKKFDINQMRVATPCHVGWENMSGDDKVRLCHSCKINIYNVAEMTPAEVQTLILNREDRICIRLYRRNDGTVITRDCPVGLQALRKRMTKFAGACLTLVLGLFSNIFAHQFSVSKDTHLTTNFVDQQKNGTITGTITDSFGAVVPAVEVILINDKTKNKLKVSSNEDGIFTFNSLAPDLYTLKIELAGFKKRIILNIEVKPDKVKEINIALDSSGENEVVGIFAEEPSLELLELNETKRIEDKLTPHKLIELPLVNPLSKKRIT